MKIKFLNRLMIAGSFALSIIYSACTPDYPSAPSGNFSSGTADFTKYVAIGNSLTAGYQNGGIRDTFQSNSYPRMIGALLGQNLTYPIFPDSGTAGSLFLNGFDSKGKPILVSSVINRTPTNLGAALYENLGIPGVFLYDFSHATATSNGTSWQQLITGTTNAAIDAVLRGQGTQFQQLKAHGATFATFWLGNNDILGYATGGAGKNGNPVDGANSVIPFTSVNDGGINPALPGFRTMYNQAMDSLVSVLGTNFAVANIPDVSSIPHMTTIKKADVDSAQIAPGVKIKVYFAEDQAQIKYYLLSLSSALPKLLAAGVGTTPGNPVPGKYTITNTEAGIITNVVNQYNAIIDSAANRVGVPVFDAHGLLAAINAVSTAGGGPTAPGYSIGSGLRVKSDYISGGLFSLDGVHPSTLGYAVVANGFIDVINAHFGSSVPHVDLNQFVVYP